MYSKYRWLSIGLILSGNQYAIEEEYLDVEFIVLIKVLQKVVLPIIFNWFVIPWRNK